MFESTYHLTRDFNDVGISDSEYQSIVGIRIDTLCLNLLTIRLGIFRDVGISDSQYQIRVGIK